MKTLKNKEGTKFVRVLDKKKDDIGGIKELLASGWSYCPKSEWKKKVRDAKPKRLAAKKTPKKKGGKKKSA